LAGRARRIWLSLVLALLVPAAATTSGGEPPSPSSQLGEWQILDTAPSFTPIHAALMHTGRVWLGAGSANDVVNFDAGDFRSFVWDPSDGSIDDIPTP
jgi:hypothetical protein